MSNSASRLRYLGVLLLSITTLPLFAEPVAVTDDRGRQLILATPAKRIISLGPSMTELLFAVGAGEQVIAVDRSSDYPSHVTALPHVGDVTGINLETILAMQPDLLVVWDSGFHSSALVTLEERIPIYYAEPRRLVDIATTLQRLAVLSGHAIEGKLASEKFSRHLDILQAKYRHAQRITGFYQVWRQPLLSIGKSHVIADVMALCGVENIFADSNLIVPHIDIEAVMQRHPQLIITGTENQDMASRRFWGTWLNPDSFTLLHVDPELLARHSPRILDGAEQLCDQVEHYRNNIR